MNLLDTESGKLRNTLDVLHRGSIRRKRQVDSLSGAPSVNMNIGDFFDTRRCEQMKCKRIRQVRPWLLFVSWQPREGVERSSPN